MGDAVQIDLLVVAQDAADRTAIVVGQFRLVGHAVVVDVPSVLQVGVDVHPLVGAIVRVEIT